MRATIVFIILLASLFAFAYITKRRFGVLGLALCAGVLLSNSWASSLTPFLEGQGISLASPPLAAVVAAGLILLPPILLFFSGPTNDKPVVRIGGAAAFAILAFVFLLDPLGSALVFDDFSTNIYSTLLDYSDLLIIAGISFALFDVITTRSPRSSSKGKSKGEH